MSFYYSHLIGEEKAHCLLFPFLEYMMVDIADPLLLWIFQYARLAHYFDHLKIDMIRMYTSKMVLFLLMSLFAAALVILQSI